VILLHDAANEIVRAGLEAVEYGSWPKVSTVDHDFIPGYLVKTERFHHEIWGGWGLILIADRGSQDRLHTISEVAYPVAPILADHRARLLSGARDQQTGPEERELGSAEIDELRSRLADLEARLSTVIGSRTWRMTTPLRRVAARLRG